ncbi:MAG: histidinol dehydrogenase [Abditibacteriota bacterium]|nr:histidinol dehydrogenase [Abditibacteriota bacterium]
MKTFDTAKDNIKDILAALSPASGQASDSVRQTVADIIEKVKTEGDKALLELGRKFDSPDLDAIEVTTEELKEAYALVSDDLLNAIRVSKTNIERFHKKQLRNTWIDMQEGFIYGQLVRPLEIVGIYAPAAKAPLPSTVIMTAVPAKVAGVETVVLCVPAREGGKVIPAMLVAAHECGVDRVFKVGGAQAAAAMAFGTETVPAVNKIVGPGNIFYTEAKRQVYGFVGIDQLAGPSEILVIADETANPAYAAADFLSQAEHAPDSRCVLVTTSEKILAEVLAETEKQAAAAERKECVEPSLRDYAVAIAAHSIDECVNLANAFAPEHLEICTADPWSVVKKIKNAGTIMLGHYTPVPLCDFAAGPNHTLPTAGTAKFSSPLSVDDFVKKSGLLSYTKEALKEISPVVYEFAEAEGLPAHGNTVKIRVD